MMRHRMSVVRGRSAARLAAAAAITLALLGCQSPGPTDKEQARQAWDDHRAALKYELASAELRQGRVDKALPLACEAVGLSPQQPAHVELLARTYMAKGDFRAARNVLRSLQTAHPDSAPAAYLLGTIYERERRWDLAIESYTRAVQASPDDLDYRIALAQAVAETSDSDKALGLLEEVYGQFASEPRYHLACAELCRCGGHVEKACAAYRCVLRLGVDDTAVRSSLGLCLYWAGRPEEAIDYLGPLVRESPEPEPAVMCAYAGCLLSTGEVQLAADWLNRFTSQRPDNGQLWLLLAQARSALDDWDGATMAVSRALRLGPGSPEGLTVAAAVHLATGDIDQAAATITEALRLDPQNVEVLLLYGRVCEHRGDCSTAAEAYRTAWELEPSDFVAELLARVED